MLIILLILHASFAKIMKSLKQNVLEVGGDSRGRLNSIHDIYDNQQTLSIHFFQSDYANNVKNIF
jgi:hypothetical protein